MLSLNPVLEQSFCLVNDLFCFFHYYKYEIHFFSPKCSSKADRHQTVIRQKNISPNIFLEFALFDFFQTGVQPS